MYFMRVQGKRFTKLKSILLKRFYANNILILNKQWHTRLDKKYENLKYVWIFFIQFTLFQTKMTLTKLLFRSWKKNVYCTIYN